MFSAFTKFRNPLRWAVLGLLALLLAGCQMAGPNLGTGPRISGETVEVAMLLPLSSPQGGDAIIARSLENAARLAATEQTGVTSTCASTTPTATRPRRRPSRGRRFRKAPMSSWGRCARNRRPPWGWRSPIPASRS
jgi:hypothetical protein